MNPHEYLNSFKNFESNLDKLNGKEFDLTRVDELLDLLGSPQKDLKIIHVAGTKGKGSTCAFLSYILAASGFRVGLYTSPHLHVLNERIRVLDKAAILEDKDFGGMITDDQLIDVISALRPHIAALTNRGSFVTYFEVMTVAAIYFFSKQNLNWVVLETGLGGRLDATNAADSTIAVLTPISLEHVQLLGDTLAKIAVEKSGIIKNSRQRVVIAPQTPEAQEVILKRCQEFGIPPILVDPEKYKDMKVALKGVHQRLNAATAMHVVELLRQWAYKIPDEAVAEGLKNTRWPGRFEIIRRAPTVILDGAHNAASARCLAETLAAQYPDRKIIFVLGMSADKEIESFIHELKTLASQFILTQAAHPRAHRFTTATPEVAEVSRIIPTVKDALNEALADAKDEDVIVVTGSLYVVAEARENLKEGRIFG